MTSTPGGAGTARFAARSVTSAPRRAASAARATPIRPDERLPRKRTASSGSRVPPAGASTRRPAPAPPPRGDDHAPPRPRAHRPERRLAGGEDRGGFGEPPDSPLALGQLALVG